MGVLHIIYYYILLKPSLGKLLHTHGQMAPVAVLGTHAMHIDSHPAGRRTSTEDLAMQAGGHQVHMVGGDRLPKASRVRLRVLELGPPLPQPHRNKKHFGAFTVTPPEHTRSLVRSLAITGFSISCSGFAGRGFGMKALGFKGFRVCGNSGKAAQHKEMKTQVRC